MSAFSFPGIPMCNKGTHMEDVGMVIDIHFITGYRYTSNFIRLIICITNC